MAETGAWVPRGGIYEIVLALQRLADAAGVELRTGEAVTSLERGRVTTTVAEYPADLVVSALDADRLNELLGRPVSRSARTLSCSAIAIYGVLQEALPEDIATHSVILPSKPAALHRSLAAGDEPADTMAFVNHYRAGEVYPNERSTLGILLTSPADAQGLHPRASVRTPRDRTHLDHHGPRCPADRPHGREHRPRPAVLRLLR